MSLTQLYRPSLALLTDLYQLTMAYGYWKGGVAERESVFHLHFRRPPFGGGYAIAAGIEEAVEYLAALAFDASDREYLATLTGADGKPLFDAGFLDYLGGLRFTGTVDAVPEGRLVFAHEPLVRVRAPILQAQLVETALLTMVNFSTLIATKAARVCHAARGEPVLEFGLRRAQGIDGGLTASRAAWIGGVAATSNVLAGKLYGIPVRGTHAHSWVMFWGDELHAFREYARSLPANCNFLVDTFDSLDGVRNAIAIGHELRARGHDLLGIRLDSGDLAHLSIEARALLDAAGFTATRIVASNDLDETLIASLREQGARIDTWGVGTKLATGYDQPALGGVYKLGAVREDDGSWRYPIKLSEQPIKITTPGIQGVRRYRRDGVLVGDVIVDALAAPPADAAAPATAWDLDDPTRSFQLDGDVEELLITVMKDGAPTGAGGDLEAARARASADLASLSPRTRRHHNPQPYPVGLDPVLHERKLALVARARAHAHGAAR
ncbi:MAG TPA: nicotinate phosphoribosyltransferase [Kofleriaceae bacterium]|jgi:nicotinate phosphoribosyltransferase|nr:nicotinate phosphoribosyltransferase [Kofleriaceae bacterium]